MAGALSTLACGRPLSTVRGQRKCYKSDKWLRLSACRCTLSANGRYVVRVRTEGRAPASVSEQWPAGHRRSRTIGPELWR